MKKHILTLLFGLLFPTWASAHGEVEIGPNGGRILEFSKNESMHGEVRLTDNQFHIALLDKNMKPVALGEQELSATSGDRSKPEKLQVEKKDGAFVVPVVKAGEWVIFQFRENAKAKPVTARFQYDLTICSSCKAAEWICQCAAKEGKGKK
jgi:hypothetical protein